MEGYTKVWVVIEHERDSQSTIWAIFDSEDLAQKYRDREWKKMTPFRREYCWLDVEEYQLMDEMTSER